MTICERCEIRPGNYYDERDMWLCDSCETTMNEQAYERMLSDYYGGSGPVTLQEQYDAAAKQKREMDR